MAQGQASVSGGDRSKGSLRLPFTASFQHAGATAEVPTPEVSKPIAGGRAQRRRRTPTSPAASRRNAWHRTRIDGFDMCVASRAYGACWHPSGMRSFCLCHPVMSSPGGSSITGYWLGSLWLPKGLKGREKGLTLLYRVSNNKAPRKVVCAIKSRPRWVKGEFHHHAGVRLTAEILAALQAAFSADSQSQG